MTKFFCLFSFSFSPFYTQHLFHERLIYFTLLHLCIILTTFQRSWNGVVLAGSVDLCASVHEYVHLSRLYGYLPWTNGCIWMRQFRHTYEYLQDTFVCRFLSKSSTSLTFIFKVQDSDRVRWEVPTWFSRKRRQIGQTLLSPTNRKSHVNFRLVYLHVTIAHFNGRVKVVHNSTTNILQMVTYRVKIAIGNK